MYETLPEHHEEKQVEFVVEVWTAARDVESGRKMEDEQRMDETWMERANDAVVAPADGSKRA